MANWKFIEILVWNLLHLLLLEDFFSFTSQLRLVCTIYLLVLTHPNSELLPFFFVYHAICIQFCKSWACTLNLTVSFISLSVNLRNKIWGLVTLHPLYIIVLLLLKLFIPIFKIHFIDLFLVLIYFILFKQSMSNWGLVIGD